MYIDVISLMFFDNVFCVLLQVGFSVCVSPAITHSLVLSSTTNCLIGNQAQGRRRRTQVPTSTMTLATNITAHSSRRFSEIPMPALTMHRSIPGAHLVIIFTKACPTARIRLATPTAVPTMSRSTTLVPRLAIIFAGKQTKNTTGRHWRSHYSAPK